MALEVKTDKAICHRCGKAFGKRRGSFPVSYSLLNRGAGYLPICKECVEKMYDGYLAQCNDPAMAVRQMCRKLDLYWNQKVFDSVFNKNTTRSLFSAYLTRLTTNANAGKSYDDTLLAEGTLWNFGASALNNTQEDKEVEQETQVEPSVDDEPVDDAIVAFWGSGYTPSMYRELEQRRSYWMEKFPSEDELDIGTEAIVKQICALELDINRDRAAGRAVDKSINALNTLLGSANLKPTQRKQDDVEALADTPMGVWLYRFENERPLPDEYDESKILKYMFTWMGHLCKMLGVKGNKYTKLYEDEIRKYTVEKPEYEGDDEEAFLDMLDSIEDE